MRLLMLLPALCLAFFLWATTTPENTYQYELDLTQVEDDKVPVSLLAPTIEKASINFFFPKIIPGTYTIYDFGRFVSDFKAFDKDGNLLEVDRKDVNTFRIKNARQLHRISYRVDDTFDATTGKSVWGMSGSNIEAGKNFVVNGHAFFGYFEGMKFQPFSIRFKKPEGFAGSSALTPVESGTDYDLFQVKDYHMLADSPIMYCKPDNTTLEVANADVLISVYSPSGNIQSSYLADRYKDLLLAQKDYLGGVLPVDRYAFIKYFFDPAKMTVGTGALEHNYSSLYVLPDMPQEQIIQFLLDIAAHEFFHIVTPLNVHSEEIHYFDFNDPDMSRHLWMYEGVTEYFAHHVQVSSGLIDLDHFLNNMEQKVLNAKSQYNDQLPFTRLSRKCLHKHAGEYGNVYEKGALIGLCLDIELRRLSKGAYGLVNLMEDLSKRYGNDEPFKDNQLFKVIESMTYPEIGDFFKKYVDGKEMLPLASIFAQVGIAYTGPVPYMDFSMGKVALNFNPETKRVFIENTGSMNAFGKAMGYEVGDEFHAINGERIPEGNLYQFFQRVTSEMEEGKRFEVQVYRANSAGEKELVTLAANAFKVEKMKAPELSPVEDPSSEALLLRKQWLRH